MFLRKKIKMKWNKITRIVIEFSLCKSAKKQKKKKQSYANLIVRFYKVILLMVKSWYYWRSLTPSFRIIKDNKQLLKLKERKKEKNLF